MDFLRSACLFIICSYAFMFVLFTLLHIFSMIAEYIRARTANQKSHIVDYKEYVGMENLIPVSLIIPVSNDGDAVVDAVNRALSIDYKLYEIIVVDDGSSDNTSQNIIGAFGMEQIESAIKRTIPHRIIREVWYSAKYPNLLYIKKDKGGTFDAVNCGLNASQYPLYICIDPRGEYEKDAILRLSVEFFKDSATIVSSGVLRIQNRQDSNRVAGKSIATSVTYLQGVQMAECTRMTGYDKTSRDAYHILYAKCGSFSLISKQLAYDMKGYKTDTEQADYDMLLSIERHMRKNKKVYKLVKHGDVMCMVNENTHYVDAMVKAKRFQNAQFDLLKEFFGSIFTFKYKSFGLYKIPYNIVFNILYPFMECLAYIALPLTFNMQWMGSRTLIFVFFIYVLVNILLTIGAFLTDQKANKNYLTPKFVLVALLFSLVETFGYRQLMLLSRFIGFFSYFPYKRNYKTEKKEYETKYSKRRVDIP